MIKSDGWVLLSILLKDQRIQIICIFIKSARNRIFKILRSSKDSRDAIGRNARQQDADEEAGGLGSIWCWSWWLWLSTG